MNLKPNIIKHDGTKYIHREGNLIINEPCHKCVFGHKDIREGFHLETICLVKDLKEFNCGSGYFEEYIKEVI